MKQYLSAIILIFFVISCKKETSVEGIINIKVPIPNNQKQLITAEFLDGQILKTFTYDNSGKLIGVRNYNHPKNGEGEWILEITNNSKGLPIKESYRLPSYSTIYKYRTYTYNINANCIADTTYDLGYDRGNAIYFPWKTWNAQNNEYDAQGRVQKTYIIEDGTKHFKEFTYNNDGNIIKEFNSFSDNTWFSYTNQYEFNNDVMFNHPLEKDLYAYNYHNHNTDKNFCTKSSNGQINYNFTIEEKNAQGNPTKIRWNIKWAWDGSTQADIYTYTYK